MPELQDPDIFRTMLESLETGVYVVGREGRILFWNHGSVIGAAESFDEQRLVPETDSSESNLAAHHCLDVGSGALTHELIQSHLRENVAFFRNSSFHSAFCTSVSIRWTSSVPPMAARQPRPFSM